MTPTIIIDSMTAIAEMVMEREMQNWPDCVVKDCTKKVCKWSRTNCCHLHATEILGKDEMKRRLHASNYGADARDFRAVTK